MSYRKDRISNKMLMMAAIAIAANGGDNTSTKNANVVTIASQATQGIESAATLQPIANVAANCRASPIIGAGMCTVHNDNISPTAVADTSGGRSYHAGKLAAIV